MVAHDDNEYSPSCYYEIRTAKYTFKTGRNFIKFSKIDEGAIIHINGGESWKSADAEMVEGNISPIVGTKYSLDMTSNIVVSAYARMVYDNTEYAFEYWTEGEEYPIMD